MKKLLLMVFAISISLFFNTCSNQQKTSQFDQPPEWAKNVIWYQIFWKRFKNQYFAPLREIKNYRTIINLGSFRNCNSIKKCSA